MSSMICTCHRKLLDQKKIKQGLCYTKVFFTDFACVFIRKCEFGGFSLLV